jgi:hypothetical protein
MVFWIIKCISLLLGMDRMTEQEYLDQIDKEDKERKQKLKEFQSLLSSLQIELNISGCGCCGSPEVAAWYKGQKLFQESNVNLRMRKDDE